VKYRNSFIILGVLALLLICSFGLNVRPRSIPKDYTSYSTEENGFEALHRWLGSLEYDVQRLAYREFELGQDDDAFILANPSSVFTASDTQVLLDWVAQGNTAIIIQSSSRFQNNLNELLDTLAVQTKTHTDVISVAAPSQPVFDQYPFEDVLVVTERYLESQNSDIVPLLSADGQMILGGLKHGQGYLYLSSSDYLLNNSGLGEPENALVVQTLLRRIPAKGRILFDEYHHGFYIPPSPKSSSAPSAWNWALWYAAGVFALFLVLSGRRFGRPVPLKSEQMPRSSIEYIESMANLFERGQKRDYIQDHYYSKFKRQLALAHGLNPKLPDQDFVTELSLVSSIDKQALLQLLGKLQQTQKNEADLLKVIHESEEFIKQARS
jgi:hypothetical protein